LAQYFISNNSKTDFLTTNTDDVLFYEKSGKQKKWIQALSDTAFFADAHDRRIVNAE